MKVSNLASKAAARILVESKVDAAINARVVDVVGDLVEVGVVKRNPGTAGLAIVIAWPPAPYRRLIISAPLLLPPRGSTGSLESKAWG